MVWTTKAVNMSEKKNLFHGYIWAIDHGWACRTAVKRQSSWQHVVKSKLLSYSQDANISFLLVSLVDIFSTSAAIALNVWFFSLLFSLHTLLPLNITQLTTCGILSLCRWTQIHGSTRFGLSQKNLIRLDILYCSIGKQYFLLRWCPNTLATLCFFKGSVYLPFCSVQLYTWTDAVSNKVGPPLIWCSTQRLLPRSRQYSNSLLDLPLQSSATLRRETLNLGPRQALLNTHSPPGH